MEKTWGDLGPILAVLGVMVITIGKALKNRSDSSIRNPKIMENYWDIAISDFGFRGTFKEMRVCLFSSVSGTEVG